MAAGHVDSTILANVDGNTQNQTVADPAKVKAFFDEVASKINDNYDDAVSLTSSQTVTATKKFNDLQISPSNSTAGSWSDPITFNAVDGSSNPITSTMQGDSSGAIRMNSLLSLLSVSGGYKVQSGSGSTTIATGGTDVQTTVTFPTAFNSTPIVVVGITGVGANDTVYIIVNASNRSTTGFLLVVNSGAAQTIDWNYIAIGT